MLESTLRTRDAFLFLLYPNHTQERELWVQLVTKAVGQVCSTTRRDSHNRSVTRAEENIPVFDTKSKVSMFSCKFHIHIAVVHIYIM